MSNTKLLLETLRMADGGRVECSVSTPDGLVRGVIENSFFADFLGVSEEQAMEQLTQARQNRIIMDNVSYFEEEADRLCRLGNRELVIK